MNEKEITKLIRSKYPAINENLVTSDELYKIKGELERFLDKNLIGESLLALRYRKFRSPGKGCIVFLTGENGYPLGDGGAKWIEPYLDFFEKYMAEKALVKRIEDDNLWVESRIQDNEQYLFVGKKKSETGEKVHLIFGQTGEIRIDKKDLRPGEIMKKIESLLQKEDGSIVETTIEFFNEKIA